MLCERHGHARQGRHRPAVLILVLMEDALRAIYNLTDGKEIRRLNPCSNGRCSASDQSRAVRDKGEVVLILVLMEDALRALDFSKEELLTLVS